MTGRIFRSNMPPSFAAFALFKWLDGSDYTLFNGFSGISGALFNRMLASTDFFHGNHVMLASILTYLVFFVCLVSVMALYSRSLKQQAEASKTSEGDRPEDELENAKKRITDEFSLTERESEIMLLTCKGYSKRKIAETLFISENIVREYSQRLYGKLDIHSKEELIDIFEGCFEARR